MVQEVLISSKRIKSLTLIPLPHGVIPFGGSAQMGVVNGQPGQPLQITMKSNAVSARPERKLVGIAFSQP